MLNYLEVVVIVLENFAHTNEPQWTLLRWKEESSASLENEYIGCIPEMHLHTLTVIIKIHFILE